jgi:transcriptional regulator of acetoin/glycerol metabolism
MIPDTDLHTLKSLSRAVRGGTLDALRLAERAYAMGSEACHAALSRSFAPPETFNLDELERIAFVRALEASGGSILAAARLLGISKTNAYRKARRYGIRTGLVCPNCHTAVPRRPACNPA